MERAIVELLDQFERGKISRRQLVQNLVLGMAAASASTAASAQSERHRGFKALYVNHISYGVKDYRVIRDFYADLFNMRVSEDTGQQCALSFGQTVIIARHSKQPGEVPFVDHICYTIASWDRDKVEAELGRRGLNPQPDTTDSFHIRDPAGYDVQIAGPNMKAAPS